MNRTTDNRDLVEVNRYLEARVLALREELERMRERLSFTEGMVEALAASPRAL